MFERVLLIAVLSLSGFYTFPQPVLPPPDSLTASQECDFINLKWHEPDHESFTLEGYNIFLGDSLLTTTLDTTFQIQKQGNGFVTFNVTTVYVEGESQPATIEVELVIFAPATNLVYDEEECEFRWSAPQGNLPGFFNKQDETLQWCDDTGDNSIGTGNEVEFEVAAVWSPESLSQFQQGLLYLKNVEFWPAESQATYSIKIWESQDPEAPELLLFSMNVDNFIVNQWNTIQLYDSVMIDIEKYLWIGYSVNTPTGYPAGVDEGPAADGFGNMMNFGGWQTLLEINPDLDYNWKIIARFSFIDTFHLQYDIVGYWSCLNWGQHWVKLNEEPITDTNFYYPCIMPIAEHYPNECFVQVHYCNMTVNSDTSEYNICYYSESDPIDSEEHNTVTVSNANQSWIIFSKEKINRVKVYDMAGRVMYQNSGEMEMYSIDNQDLSAGIYILEISTDRESISRKVIK